MDFQIAYVNKILFRFDYNTTLRYSCIRVSNGPSVLIRPTDSKHIISFGSTLNHYDKNVMLSLHSYQKNDCFIIGIQRLSMEIQDKTKRVVVQ